MAPEVHLDDDFRALGLEPGAEASEVKRAYRTLVKKWHPDRHQLEPYESRVLAEEKFREIDEAYRRISKNRGKASPFRRPAGGDFSAARPAAPKPRTAFRFNRRPGSGTRLFAGTQRVQPATLSLAVAAFILILLFPLLLDIGTYRPIRVQKKAKGHPPIEETHAPVRPQTALPARAPHPALPKPGPAASVHFFTLGSSASRVLEVQGRPGRILGDTWIYGLSDVRFSNGRVCGYDNFGESLRVRIVPGAHKGSYPHHITIGSTKQQVLLVQGTPTRVAGNRWYYGFAELIFMNGLVTGYDNYFGTLKMRILPSTPSGHGKRASFFTKGSTPDEVLAAQGTPTAVHGNRWSYNFDYVFFRDGKVSGVLDADGALNFANHGKSGLADEP